jgi:hypothetical protein
MQQRLKKYSRDSSTYDAVSRRQITKTSLSILATIHDYRILPTSLLVRLVAGNEKNLHRHLQQLYHKGLVNRFAFLHGKNPSEFHYYLDKADALDLLVAAEVPSNNLDFIEVRRNREKAYCDINNPEAAAETPGKLLFLKHEVMISRFHAMLELACRASKGRIELSDFRQGPALWSKVEVPSLHYERGEWDESGDCEFIPHRPDAFFTLSFSKNDQKESRHFFYEADRHRTNTHRFNKKLRGHFHFVVKQKLHQKMYGIDRIRAVLTETVDDQWAERLREAAGHQTVSGSKPSPLFWFTTSRLFSERPPNQSSGSRGLPAYLRKPEVVLSKIWASPVDDTLYSLGD